MIRSLFILLALFATGPSARGQFSNSAEALTFFEEKIRPVLAEKCYSCHSAESEKLKGSLQVDHLEHLITGGETGPSVVSGKPEESLLIEAMSYGNRDLQMPPKERLAQSVVDDFREWIKAGAPWPEEPVPLAGGESAPEVFDLEKRREEHWCWKALTDPALPELSEKDWPRLPIDYFILYRLEAAGLRPAEPADDRTWLRRVYFDLTGLPPSVGEIHRFLDDTSPERREKVVDELLASPHYGEKWARHWMDLVRYAETYGHEFDYPIHFAHEYRDYLIRAFNADLPFDQFAREHIAGDLIRTPRINEAENFNESVLGTGFWFLNEATHAPTDVLANEADHMSNQIDVYSKAFLGLTVSCARCHDHKFDAISTADYYGLTGYLHSSARTERSMDPGKVRQNTAVKQRELLTRADASLIPSESKTAATTNPSDAGIFADFESESLPEGWNITGEAFAPTGTAARFTLEEGVLFATPGTVSSIRLGEAHSGVLRSPTFTIESDEIHVRLRARGGLMRVVIDNYHMAVHQPLLFGGTVHKEPDTKGTFTWMQFGGDLKKYRGHRAFLEFVDPGPGYYEIDEIRFSRKTETTGDGKVAGKVSTAISKEVEDLLSEGRRLAASLPPERFALTMSEGTPERGVVYVRGSHRSLGEEVPLRFLEALGAREGDRLTLAEETVSPENPLTSRVIVNRLWHHLIGQGIVASVDDFGPMGQMPTHPELLDWLASDLIKSGWSLKNTIRQIVLSQTYAQASIAHPDIDKTHLSNTDPTNALLHRMPVRRLPAEAIRDGILAVSGSLDPTLYGPAIPTHRTDFMSGRGARESGPLDGGGRRTIYGAIYRNFLSPFLMTFDMPNPFGPKGNRGASNVPAQALALMNDPFVIDQGKKWADRILAENGLDENARIARMFEAATTRTPDQNTTAALAAFLKDQSRAYGASDSRAWADLAHILLNQKDFIYLR